MSTLCIVYCDTSILYAQHINNMITAWQVYHCPSTSTLWHMYDHIHYTSTSTVVKYTIACQHLWHDVSLHVNTLTWCINYICQHCGKIYHCISTLWCFQHLHGIVYYCMSTLWNDVDIIAHKHSGLLY